MRSRYVFAVLALLVGAVCIRLGFWQLDRLRERRAHNAAIAARMEAPVADLTTLTGDTGVVRFRRARITGVADYANELVLGGRTREGSPGVNLLTPVRVAGRDTAWLVNRGWVYSPDAATPPAESWHESDTVTFEGYVEVLTAGGEATPNPARPRALPRPTLAAARARMPYPIAGTYLVAQLPADTAGARVPSRLVPPRVTDEGSHLGYAMQWFFFATVAIVGAGIALRRRS